MDDIETAPLSPKASESPKIVVERDPDDDVDTEKGSDHARPTTTTSVSDTQGNGGVGGGATTGATIHGTAPHDGGDSLLENTESLLENILQARERSSSLTAYRRNKFQTRSGIYFTIGLVAFLYGAGLYINTHLPSPYDTISIAISTFLVVLLYVMLAGVHLTDPGMLTPKPAWDEEGDEPIHCYTRYVEEGEITVLKRYCAICHIWRPPRTSHCKWCNACFERYDHHCPWVGNCIGVRNYRKFIWFLTTLECYAFFVIGACLTQLILIGDENEQDDFFDTFFAAISDAPVALILIFFVFLAILFVAGLCGFHTFLMCTNQTTNEQLKGQFVGKGNPYSSGVCSNFNEILCSKQDASKLRLRTLASEVDGDAEAPVTRPSNPTGSTNGSAADPSDVRLDTGKPTSV
eukprot:GFYU01004920.1.p1 GENE.GFYU01004920.1~~GFYU01004920.1.p1  ORF type:complete len:406 (+),score=74.90 GFYU01004920.1:118-1335(+)